MWLLLIFGFYIGSVSSYLIRRKLAGEFQQFNKLINAIWYVFFLLPTSLLLLPFFPHDLAIGWTNLALLIIGSLIFPIYNLVAFKANQNVDVGVFSIINNLSPLFTLAIAVPLLAERPSALQYLGIFLLVLASFTVSITRQKKAGFKLTSGILLSLTSAILLGMAIAYERYMLSRIDFGAYLVFGWGSQILWMSLLTGRQWLKLPNLVSEAGYKVIIGFGSSNAFRSICFIMALLISGSASLTSAATSFSSVLVVIAAYFILNERNHIYQKLSATVIGICGLLLLAL